jgi:hypothetical protein
MKQIAGTGGSGGAPPGGPGPASGAIRIAAPSSQFRAFTPKSGAFTIQYPDNWRPLESPDGAGVTIVPDGGVVATRGGEPSVVYGVIVNQYAPFEGSIGGRSNARGPFAGHTSLEDATNDLVRQTMHANPYLSPVRESVRRENAGGLPAISLDLVGRSPVTGMEERVRLGTRQQRDGEVIYSLTIAPGRDSAALAPTYDRMLASLQPRSGPPRG